MTNNLIETQIQAEETDRIEFFNTVYQSFQRATQQVGRIDRFYEVGGYTICLSFAGSSLVSHLTPAIAHIEIEKVAQPDLTVCLWDNYSTQTKMPLLISSLIDLITIKWWDILDPRQDIKGFNSDRIRSNFHIGPNILSLLDTHENIALYWLENAEQLPYWEHGSPLRTILNWWTSDRDRQYVHAGAVGTAMGGVLLAGKGGSGKSTTALSCLNSNLTYASDDYCLISNNPVPYVYSLYNTAKLKGLSDIERFPHLRPLISNSDRLDAEKAMIFLKKHYPEKVVKGFPIKAILIPKVTGKIDTNIQKSSSILALKALAPSTMFQLSGSGEKAFQTMSQLVKQVPCYVLEVGTDLAQIPDVISQLISRD